MSEKKQAVDDLVVEAPAAIVEDDAPRRRKLVNAKQLAKELGVGKHTVLAKAEELGGHKYGREWKFELEEVTKRKRVVFAPQARQITKERGAVAAEIFPLFRALMPLDEIAEKCQVDPKLVLDLFNLWQQMREVSAKFLAASPQLAQPEYDHEPSAHCCPAHELLIDSGQIPAPPKKKKGP